MRRDLPSHLPARARFETREYEQHDQAAFATAIANLYVHAPKVLLANVINAAIVTAVLWGRIDSTLLLGWLAAMTAMSTVRALLAGTINATDPPTHVAAAARRFTIGAGVSGVIWGGGALAMFPVGDLASQVLLAFVIGGMCAGSSSSVASHLPAFYAFLGPALVPLLLRFAFMGDRFHLGMAAMLALFGVLVVLIGRTNNRTMLKSYRLGFVNDALVERLCDAHGELEGANTALEARVVSRTRDLEEQTAARRSAEKQLHRAQKLEAIGRLTGGVAHDFNNLLTVIVGALDGLESVEDPHQRQQLVRHARQAAVRGGGLTRSLLAFSRREPLHPEVVDPAEIVRSLTSTMVRRALPESIDLHVKILDAPRLIEVDCAQLETALLNLILNARDAMPDGGTLLVELRAITIDPDADTLAPGPYIELWVADTGQGIEPELLDRIFEPFFTTKGDDGTGLGLSMVYGFAEQSGGAIRIESTLGSGTSARLLLPRSNGQVAARARPTSGPAPAGDGQLILLVEDDETVRELSALSLQGLGYRPLQACNALEALDVLEANPEIALVMTDVVMPGPMDGVALAHEVQRRRPNLPVVVASGYSEGAAANASAFPTLAKPYRRAALARTLERLLCSTDAAQ